MEGVAAMNPGDGDEKDVVKWWSGSGPSPPARVAAGCAFLKDVRRCLVTAVAPDFPSRCSENDAYGPGPFCSLMQAAAAIPAAFPDEPNDVPMECRGRTQSFERRRSLHDLHHMHESEPDGKKQPKSWSCWESNPGGQKFRRDPLCGSLKIWNAKPLHHTTSLVPAG